MDYREYLVRDPNIRFGRTTIKGTRISVEDVLGWLAAGESIDSVLKEWDHLTENQIRACLAFASDREGIRQLAS